MEKIDNLDRKILGILSKNARIPFKDVAAMVYEPVVKWHSTISGMFCKRSTTFLYILPRSKFKPT